MTKDLAAEAARLSILAATEDTPEAHEAAATARRVSADAEEELDILPEIPTVVL